MADSSSVTVVEQALRFAIRRLPPGAQLPSVRAVMATHRVSPVTVRQAMARLAAEGAIDARPGHGTFVAARRAPAPDVDFGWQGLALGSGRIPADDVAALLTPPPAGAINLAGGYPSEDLQAVDLVTKAMTRAVRRPGVWGRMPLEGVEGLRTWVANEVGPSVSMREVVICPGSQAAIATAFHALAEPGSPVLVESPSYVGALAAARAAALRLVPVPTDADGVVPELLARAFETSGAHLCYLQPRHANPSGATLSSARRAEVLEIARRYRALVIEDDWCRDLSFDRLPPRPLVADDAGGHCVYIRSLTKSAAPGLRVGAIVARGAAFTRLAASRMVSEFFVSGPMQEAALDVVTSAAWQRHLRRVRDVLRGRRDVLVAAVRRELGEAAIRIVPTGGMHLWVRLPDAVDADAVAQRAGEQGVVVTGGRRWFPAEPTGSFLRVSYGCAGDSEITRGVEVLARLVEAAGPPSAGARGSRPSRAARKR